ncbi:MAG: type IX secretion system outer membrane channel protein PorV [Saprospiraceae bacterium]
MNFWHKLLIFSLLYFSIFEINAQIHWSVDQNCFADSGGQCVTNTLLTAVPFLRIAPDARSGAMGDVGVATSPDANSMHFNASNLVFAEEASGLSITYTPWLRNLNLNDIFLMYLSGYYKLGKNQVFGGAIRYFSLGDIDFTDSRGGTLGQGFPREFDATLMYGRKLGDKLSASLSAKYIYSTLTGSSSFLVGSVEINNAKSFAADLGLTYKSKTSIGGTKGDLTVGMAITNIGSKVTYNNNLNYKDFLPTNLGIGTSYRMDLDKHNSLMIAFDINKLMVPTPIAQFIDNGTGVLEKNPEFSKDGDEVGDYRQKSLFDGIFGSFSDAQGGLSEELKEISYNIGAEYWYAKQFAFRLGYFSEHREKGNRKYFTVGAGIKYNIFGINLSYLVPTSVVPNPLDNTLRFSLLFDFSLFSADEE